MENLDVNIMRLINYVMRKLLIIVSMLLLCLNIPAQEADSGIRLETLECDSTANNSYHQDTVSHEAKNSDTSIVREQVSHSKFVRITFLDDSCDATYIVNKGIRHFELSEYMKSQTKKLNQMSLEILKVFSEEELVDFNNRKTNINFSFGYICVDYQCHNYVPLY